MKEDREQADWFSFWLHFLLGAVVGPFLGLAIIAQRRGSIWLNEDLILPFLIGAAMAGGGFGALYGDRLWLGDNYRVIAPDTHKHSSWSSGLAIAAVVIGSMLMCYSFLRHFLP